MFFMKLYSMLTILVSILFAISSNSWLQLWTALELNMLAFIPLMYMNNSLTIMSMLKYFFIQATASNILLFSIVSLKYLLLNMFEMLFSMSLLTKLGMFPVYSWFPQVASGLSWMKNFILMFPQKIIPLFSLSLINTYNILYLSVLMTCITSMLNLWGQKSVKKIMAYSSMNHLCWMSISLLLQSSSWLLYLMIYALIILSNFKIFNLLMINTSYQFNYMMSSIMSMMIIMNLWSLGGMPPMMGFFPKLMMLNEISSTYMFSLTLILIISSLLSVLVYTNMFYPSLFNKPNHKTKFKITNMMISTNIMGLMPMFTMLMT